MIFLSYKEPLLLTKDSPQDSMEQENLNIQETTQENGYENSLRNNSVAGTGGNLPPPPFEDNRPENLEQKELISSIKSGPKDSSSNLDQNLEQHNASNIEEVGDAEINYSTDKSLDLPDPEIPEIEDHSNGDFQLEESNVVETTPPPPTGIVPPPNEDIGNNSEIAPFVLSDNVEAPSNEESNASEGDFSMLFSEYNNLQTYAEGRQAEMNGGIDQQKEQIFQSGEREKAAVGQHIQSEIQRIRDAYNDTLTGISATKDYIKNNILSARTTKIAEVNSNADLEIERVNTLFSQKKDALRSKAQTHSQDLNLFKQKEGQLVRTKSMNNANRVNTTITNTASAYTDREGYEDLEQEFKQNSGGLIQDLIRSGNEIQDYIQKGSENVHNGINSDLQATEQDLENMRLEVVANINEQRRQAIEQLTNAGEDLLASIDQETEETLAAILTHQQEQEQYLTEMGDGANSSIDQLVSDAQLNLESRKTEIATHCDAFVLQVEELGWHSDEMAEARADFDNALLSITTANLEYVTEVEAKLTAHSDTVFTEATSYSDQVVTTLTELRTNYETELSKKGDEVIAEMDKTVEEFNTELSTITSGIEPELDNKVNEQAANWATQVTDAKAEMTEKSQEGLKEQDGLLSDFSADVNSQFSKLDKTEDESFWDSVGDFFSAIGDFVVGVFEGIGMALGELWEGLKMILSSVTFWIVVGIIAAVVIVGVLIALAAGATLAAIGAALLAIGGVILQVVMVIGVIIGVAMASYYLYLMFTTPGLSARERGQLFGKALFEIGMAALDIGVFAKAKWFAKIGEWANIANKAGGWMNFLKLFNKVDDIETLVSIVNKVDNVAEILPLINKAQDATKLIRFLNEAEDVAQIIRYLGQAENMNSILSKVDDVGQLIQFINKVQDAKTLESLLGHVQSGSKLAALLEKVTNGTILERLFKTGKVTNADELLSLLNKVDNPDTLLNLLNSPKIANSAMLEAILATGKVNNADELTDILKHFDSGDDLLAFLRQSELDNIDEYARAMENGGDELSNVRTIEGRPVTIAFDELSSRAQELAQLLKNSEGETIRVASITPTDLVQLSKWFGREIGVLQSAHIDDLRLVIGTHDGILKGQVNIGEVFVLHTHPTFKSIPEHFALDLENASSRMEGVLDWNSQMTLFNKDGIVNATNPLDGSLNGLSPYHDIPFMNEAGDIVGFQKLEIKPDGVGGFDIKAVDDLKNVDDARNITTGGGGDDYARAITQNELKEELINPLRNDDGGINTVELKKLLDKLPEIEGTKESFLDFATKSMGGGDISIKPVGEVMEGATGASGAPVYLIIDNLTNQPVGILKKFPDQSEFARELSALSKLHSIPLDEVNAPKVLGTARTVDSGIMVTSLAPGKPVDELIQLIGKAKTEPERITAIENLKNSLKSNASALAELHTKPFGSGNEVSMSFIDKFANAINDMGQKILRMSNEGDIQFSSLTPENFSTNIDQLIADFKSNPGTSSIIHGDAHPGNFFYNADNGITFIDTPTLHFSLDGAGLPIGSAGRDYVNYIQKIELFAQKYNINLTNTEIKAIQDTFTDAYQAAKGAEITNESKLFFSVRGAMGEVMTAFNTRMQNPETFIQALSKLEDLLTSL